MSDNEDYAFEMDRKLDNLAAELGVAKTERDALMAELKDCKVVISLVHPDYSRFVMRALEAEKDRDRWREIALKAREALEKISKDLFRYKDRGEEVSRYDLSPMALLAKEALAIFPKEPCGECGAHEDGEAPPCHDHKEPSDNG